MITLSGAVRGTCALSGGAAVNSSLLPRTTVQLVLTSQKWDPPSVEYVHNLKQILFIKAMFSSCLFLYLSHPLSSLFLPLIVRMSALLILYGKKLDLRDEYNSVCPLF